MVTLSIAQVAEIQDELYSVQEAVRGNPVLSAKLQRIIRKLEATPDVKRNQAMREVEEDYVRMFGLSKLMVQAQQQCQQ